MANRETLAQAIADEYAALPSVLAVVQSGSVTAGNADEQSDIDLYVYSRQDVPLEARREIAMRRGRYIEVNNNFAENGDEWIERGSSVTLDVMFRPAASFEDHLTYLLERFEAQKGYSTAVWHNLRTSRILFDREGWFAALQARANAPYPDGLAQAIIALNVPLLRGHSNSRPVQIERATGRGDIVSVGITITRLLDSYFDVLFALNRVPHPGEKRLLKLAAELPLTPPNFAADVEQLLSFTSSTLGEVPGNAQRVVDGLLELLVAHGQLPPAWGEEMPEQI
ncbi:DUF4037 domain-containing protein [Deinococcus sp.]|uniref:DUF4037 domain-containing protein n=1 Tax=Deinococcus sp. TaxID=47478 RepID=UPI003B5C7EF8